MYFPKYWAKGSCESVSAWGWSDFSKAEAEQKGQERAQKILLARQSKTERGVGYPYASSPLREAILRKLPPPVDALISRNNYGCEILNTAQVVFIDVDFGAESRKQTSILANLFGVLFGKKVVSEENSPEAPKLALLKAYHQVHPETMFRVYRTAGGLRYILTSALYSPEDPFVTSLFQSVESDQHYQRLCKLQKSFRARLTPKPWRAGSNPPPVRFPFETPEQVENMAAWQKSYEVAAKEFATCKFLFALGSGSTPPEVDVVVREHDTITRAQTTLPLA